MRLYVYVLKGQDLHVKSNCYVKIQIGRRKSKTRPLKKPLILSSSSSSSSSCLVWNEEFVFRVHDLGEEVVVSVFEDNHYHDDDDDDDYDYDDDDDKKKNINDSNECRYSGLFNGSGCLVGRVRIPVWSVLDEENHTLSPTWFSLQTPHKSAKHFSKDYGKILLSISLRGKLQDFVDYKNDSVETVTDVDVEDDKDHNGDSGSSKFSRRKLPDGKNLIKTLGGRLEKLFHKNSEPSKPDESPETTTSLGTESEHEDFVDVVSENDSLAGRISFKEVLATAASRYRDRESPENLKGGVLIDQVYEASPSEMNSLLFSPESTFSRELAEVQGTTEVHYGDWAINNDGGELKLSRFVSYTKAATKLIKAVRATEEQTYIKVSEENGHEYSVFVSVSTPEVPYGTLFKVELLYKITPGSDEHGDSCRLVISWGINFVQSTMMKSIIEGGVRQGLKESFDQFSDLLGKHFKGIDSAASLSEKEQVLSSLEVEKQSTWKLAVKYLGNFTIVTTIFMVLYVFVHIMLCEPNPFQGLEFLGLDLPDSFGELVTCGILIIQFQHVYNMVSHFVQASLQSGGEHRVKAQGTGWVLTVALIEGVNLASLASSGLSDPYVVFTCNAKTRTSSVKLQSRDPQWNEILEFDAMEEPPSVLDVEVYDFDGPFDQAASLGHAEINFLKHTSTELADMWVPLEGKLAISSQSKLRLRIFLDSTNGAETIRDYLAKMEKEVGKKLNPRSPHKNATFQKLFGLPPEEFLISDFTCQLKRKLPLQGRLFLSARIVGFYANLFGHKTKFFFVWEDIDDIQILPPTLSSVGSPLLVIILKKDRGVDAKHGAKSQDEKGRFRFYFQSFVSFSGASRTIMALWRTRTLAHDQKAQIVEDEEEKYVMTEDSDYLLHVEDTKMSKVYSAELPININALMEMFEGGNLELKVMEKSGCLNYVATAWERLKDDEKNVLERHLSYKFNRHVSIFGGEVTSTQRKSPLTDDNGWILNEVMALHDVPFSNYFRVHFKYEIERSRLAHNACKCDVFMGITWLKSTKFQQRITKNIVDKFTERVRDTFALVEREILLASQADVSF